MNYKGYNIGDLERAKGKIYMTMVASNKPSGYIIGRCRYKLFNEKSYNRAISVCMAYVDQDIRMYSKTRINDV